MKPIVLMYHDVYEANTAESGFDTPGARHYKICKDTFIGHIKAITQFCEAEGRSKDDIILTFDDGNENNIKVNGFDEKVIAMYALGLSDKDIQEQIKLYLRRRDDYMKINFSTNIETIRILNPYFFYILILMF